MLKAQWVETLPWSKLPVLEISKQRRPELPQNPANLQVRWQSRSPSFGKRRRSSPKLKFQQEVRFPQHRAAMLPAPLPHHPPPHHLPALAQARLQGSKQALRQRTQANSTWGNEHDSAQQGDSSQNPPRFFPSRGGGMWLESSRWRKSSSEPSSQM